MKNKVLLIIVLFSKFLLLSSQEYSISHFGAVGDGKRVNTVAIQQAIDACHETGGVLVISTGTYITGTIWLKSRVHIRLESGAVLKGSPDTADYPVYQSQYVPGWGIRPLRSLILADGQDSIGISGAGTLDGNGREGENGIHPDTKSVRPSVISFIGCNHVEVKNIRLVNSPGSIQQYLECRHVRINGIVVHNHVSEQNTGLNIVGCDDVIINDCDISAEGNGICLETWEGSSNENISITDCMVSSNNNAIMIGPRTRGDQRYIVIKGCVIRKTGVFSDLLKRDYGAGGLVILNTEGGIVEQVMVSDLVVGGVCVPLFISLDTLAAKDAGYDPGLPAGAIREITITNFNGQSENPPECSVSGIQGHPIENIELNNVTIHAPGGGGLMLNGPDVEEKVEAGQDTPFLWKNLPAYGICFKHIKGIKLNRVNIFIDKPDHRPAVYLENTDGAEFNAFRAKAYPGIDALIHLVNTSNVTLKGTVVHPDAPVFVKVTGNKCSNIILRENIIMDHTRPYELPKGMNTGVIKVY